MWEQGIRQGALAAHLGISQAYLCLLIQDKRPLKLEMMQKIADYLKVNVNYLLGVSNKK